MGHVSIDLSQSKRNKTLDFLSIIIYNENMKMNLLRTRNRRAIFIQAILLVTIFIMLAVAFSLTVAILYCLTIVAIMVSIIIGEIAISWIKSGDDK